MASWGYDDELINTYKFNRSEQSQLQINTVWANFRWGDEIDGTASGSEFVKSESAMTWYDDCFKNHYLMDINDNYRYRIESNTVDTLILESGSEPSSGLHYITPNSNAYIIQMEWKKKIDKNLEDWLSADTDGRTEFINRDPVKMRIRNLMPGVMYRFRCRGINSLRKGAMSGWSNWQYLHPKESSTKIDYLTPQTGDFDISNYEGGLVIKRIFSDERWNGTAANNYEDALKNLYKASEFAYCDDGTCRVELGSGSITSTPSFSDVSGTTVFISPTDRARTAIPTEAYRKVRVIIRFYGKDGQVTTAKEIYEDSPIYTVGSIRATDPSIGHIIPRINYDWLADGNDYVRIPKTKKEILDKFKDTGATEIDLKDVETIRDDVINTRGSFSSINARISQRIADDGTIQNVTDDEMPPSYRGAGGIRDRVELAIAPTGKIAAGSIDSTAFAASVLSESNIANNAVNLGTKVRGTLPVANLPSGSYTEDNFYSITGTISAANTEEAFAHNAGTTPKAVILVQVDDAHVWKSKPPDATYIYLEASDISTPFEAWIKK